MSATGQLTTRARKGQPSIGYPFLRQLRVTLLVLVMWHLWQMYANVYTQGVKTAFTHPPLKRSENSWSGSYKQYAHRDNYGDSISDNLHNARVFILQWSFSVFHVFHGKRVWRSGPLLTHCSLGDVDAILKIQISFLFYLYVSPNLFMIIPSD